MRLNRIDIKGFKSFAKDTVLHFNDGVVGVVGPNGSGKSNIVDAIRWALGEQKSKELRLDRMSDVLFNGTKTKKGSGVAQVSLTFDNTKNLLPTEYNQVTISRILYRTGESEYQINHVTCRLKDIQSLLQDTGIGSNSYAIIALGMVDDILQDKEQSRRRMFEQAAGISKYKKRKHQTFLKLQSTEEDLERVLDLLHEIEQNLKTLERQAKRTQKYIDLKKSYKDLVVQLTKIKSESLREESTSLEQKFTQQSDYLRTNEIELNKIEAELESEKKLHLDKEISVSSLQRELNALVHDIRQLENQKNLDQQQLTFKHSNTERLQAQLEEYRNRLDGLTVTETQNETKIIDEKVSLEALRGDLEDIEVRKKEVFDLYGDAKENLEGLRAYYQNNEKQIFDYEKRIAVNENQILLLKSQIGQWRSQSGVLKSDISAFNNKQSEIQKSILVKEKAFGLIEKKEHERTEMLKSLKSQKEELKEELSKVHRQLDANKNEHALLKSLVENFEGFPESIQFLTKSKKWDSQAPLLSDLIYCDEVYRVVIEQYLDTYLNFFVVQHTTEAFSAIQLLSDSQKGKANFFVLDAIEEEVTETAEIYGVKRVLDVLEVEEKYLPLINRIFHNVYLTDEHFSDFVHNPIHKDATFLSMDGKWVSKRKRMISGGSVGLFEGKKIGRKKNLEKLNKKIQSLSSTKGSLDDLIAKTDAEITQLNLEEDKELAIQLQNELNQLNTQRVEVTTKFQHVEQEYSRLITKLEESEQSILQLSAEALEFKQELEKLQTAQEVSNLKLKEESSNYEELLTSFEKENHSYNEKKIEYIQQENKVKHYQNQINFAQKQRDEILTDFHLKQKQLTSESNQILNLKKDIEQIEEKLLETYAAKKDKEGNLSEVEEGYFILRGRIHELEEDLRQRNKIVQNCNLLLNEIKEKRTDIRYQLASLYERIKIEFNFAEDSIGPLLEEIQVEMNLEELELKVGKIKSRLESFGEINPLAVDAFNEMKERYDYILGQRNDILHAKESLLATIDEIERTATNHFLDAFSSVRENFVQVFRSLFSQDDDCDLVLLEPDKPLESSIEIIAKPKGKRPLILNQLSGGEKTLTAIALLFAMYLLKPAPFCIFDEVDAPLDDANVEKFNKIIQTFSKDSQFIIVTHNKLTMAAMDVIYGVYMEEQGVSSVSAVDFRSYDHTSLLSVQD